MRLSMPLMSKGLLVFLSLGVAGYAAFTYGFLPLGSLLHPDMKANFTEHAAAVYTHIFASIVALVLGPLQFSRRLRERNTALHRWMGRIYLGIGVLVGGLAGLYIAQFAYGGTIARAGFGMLALAWLYTGARAYLAIRRRAIEEHRKWMVRNFALTLAAVTLRIYLPLFLVTGMDFAVAYAMIAWLCWIPNLVVRNGYISAHDNVHCQRDNPPMKIFWRTLFVIYLIAIGVMWLLLYETRNSMAGLLFMFGLGLLGAPWSIAALFFATPNETVAYAALITFPLLNAWLIWRMAWKNPPLESKNFTNTAGEPTPGVASQLSAEGQRIISVVVVPFVLFLFFWWLIKFKNAYGIDMTKGLILAQITILLNTWVLFMNKPDRWTVIASPIILTGAAFAFVSVGRSYGYIPNLNFGAWLLLVIVIYGVSLYFRLKATRPSQIGT